MDFISNGNGSFGQVAEEMSNCRFDANMKRPYIDDNRQSRTYGKKCVTVNTGRMMQNKAGLVVPEYRKMLVADLVSNGISDPVFNATSLRKLEWVLLDQVVIRAARSRLRAWADLAAANTFGGFNGMSKLILEHETMSDPGEAVVDMDGLTEGRSDAPQYQLQGLPLPLTHSDFWFSSRRLAVSRNTGMPLDSTMAEAAGRRIAEMVEKTLIGTTTGIIYGGTPISYGRTSQVYGYTNFPNRITYTGLRTPNGTNPAQTVADVLHMRDLLYANHFFGPFMLYYSNDWDQFMDNDYILAGGNVATQTLRERLKSIEDITDVRRLDFLTSSSNPFTLLMVQMTSDVARAVNGMDITTVQWESVGGMRLNFKVLCIYVPQLRADFYNNCGILHATTS